MVTEHGNLKATEIMLFFHKFKAGCYGQFYGSVDPLIIMQALEKFCKEREHVLRRKEEQQREIERNQRAKEKCYSPQEFCKMNGMPIMKSMFEVMKYRDRIIGFVEAICNFIKILYEAQSRLQKEA